MRNELDRFCKWLISEGVDPGIDIMQLWDRYENRNAEPHVNIEELPQYRKPRFKDEK